MTKVIAAQIRSDENLHGDFTKACELAGGSLSSITRDLWRGFIADSGGPWASNGRPAAEVARPIGGFWTEEELKVARARPETGAGYLFTASAVADMLERKLSQISRVRAMDDEQAAREAELAAYEAQKEARA